jgi:hypothetical protein
MNDILFNQIGKVIEGKHKNWFIKVIDDTNHTGGYYVLICESNSFINNVYDDWLENFEDLKQYFTEKKWKIAWKK